MNEEMHGMIKIIKAIEDSAILIKGTMKTIETEIKEQKIGFLGMLLGTLGACFLGNMLAGQGIVRAGYDNNRAKQFQGIVIAGYGFKIDF